MFLTLDILKKYRACNKGIEKFEKLYPDGEEVAKIIQDPRTPSDLLHWGFEFLPVSEEEIELYKERLKIINCEDFIRSKNIEDCSTVINSKNCKNSREIKNSFNVDKSELVADSKKVTKSSYIFDSKDVHDSSFIVQSSSVHGSDFVFFGKNIYNSSNIFRSDDIFDSIGLRKCDHVENSFFCSDCEKSMNLLFCYDLTGEEYHIFNQEVPLNAFFKVQREILELFPNLSFNFATFTGHLPAQSERGYIINEDYTTHYSVSDEFYAYIKTLPQYDPFIMYMITLDPKFLQE